MANSTRHLRKLLLLSTKALMPRRYLLSPCALTPRRSKSLKALLELHAGADKSKIVQSWWSAQSTSLGVHAIWECMCCFRLAMLRRPTLRATPRMLPSCLWNSELGAQDDHGCYQDACGSRSLAPKTTKLAPKVAKLAPKTPTWRTRWPSWRPRWQRWRPRRPSWRS